MKLDEREFFITQKPFVTDNPMLAKLTRGVILYRVSLAKVVVLFELAIQFENAKTTLEKRLIVESFLTLTTNWKKTGAKWEAVNSHIFLEAYYFNFPKTKEVSKESLSKHTPIERILEIADKIVHEYPSYRFDEILNNMTLVQATILSQKIDARNALHYINLMETTSQTPEGRKEAFNKFKGIAMGCEIKTVNTDNALRDAMNNPEIKGKTLRQFLAARQAKLQKEGEKNG